MHQNNLTDQLIEAALRLLAERMDQFARCRFKDSSGNDVFVNINHKGDGYFYDDLDNPIPSAPSAS